MTSAPENLLAEVDWVRALAARLVFDPEQRSDLEQEVWHAALRRPAADGVPLRAWVTGIARHLAALLHRGGVRRRRRELAVARSDDAPSTDEVVARSELQQRLLAAVNALPGAMRDVVLLRWFEGLPPRAIARRLSVPVATVRTRQQRALALLRERLDADFGDRRTWTMALLLLPRPRDVVAAAGVFTTLSHFALALMKAKQLTAVAAALVVVAAIPTVVVLMSGGPPTPPDYRRADPVTAVFDRGAAPTPTSTLLPAAERTAAAPARTLRGRVIDADGRPIAGAMVTKEPAWYFADRVEQGLMAASDAGATSAGDGTFTLSDVGANAKGLEITATHGEHIARDERTPCTFGEPATVVMLRTHDVPMTVEVFERTTRVRPPRFQVTGTTFVPTADGKASYARQLSVPDLTEARDGRWQGTARFVAGLDYQVTASCSGCGRGWLAGASDPIPRTVVRPEPGQPLHVVFEVDFDQLEVPGAKVQRGRIVDAATQAPLAGIDVCAWSGNTREWRTWRCVQSRADGTFAIAVPDQGGLELRFEHPEWQTEERDLDLDRELIVPMRSRASLTVRLVDEAARPIAGAHLLVFSRGRREDYRHRASTDANGTLSLTGLLAGSYTVYVVPYRKAPDEHAITNSTWSVAPGQQLEVTMPITPPDAVHVRGSVLGDDAELAPAFLPLDAKGRWAEARRQGSQYDAGGLAPGEYLLVFVARQGADRALLGNVVTVRGLGTMVLDVPLPTGTVRGRIVMTTAPAAELRVVAVPANLRGAAAEIVASAKFTEHFGVPLHTDGGFELRSMPDGDFVLQLRTGEKVLAQRPFALRGVADLGDWSIAR